MKTVTATHAYVDGQVTVSLSEARFRKTAFKNTSATASYENRFEKSLLKKRAQN